MAGQMLPITSEETSMSTVARTGMRKSLYTMEAKKAAATITAMTIRAIFAGKVALMAV